MPFHTAPLSLAATELERIKQISVSHTHSEGRVFRARLILMLAEGLSYTEIQQRLGTTAPTIARWRKRFLEGRIAALLEERRPGRRPTVITPELRARVLAATLPEPGEGAAQQSCRKLAKELGTSKDAVYRIRNAAMLGPTAPVAG